MFRHWIKENGFVLGLLAVLLLALQIPSIAAPSHPFPLKALTSGGIVVIFFIQGLTLSTSSLISGVRDWRLLAFIQSTIFLLSPLLIGPAGALLLVLGYPQLAQGFFYLALLPTTISSAVAFSAAANGNVPAAIFNTSLSNVLGVFWVPLGCLLLFATDNDIGLGPALDLLGRLARLVLIPLLLGQLIRPLMLPRLPLPRLAPLFKFTNQGIILFIVFAAMAQSFHQRTWDALPSSALAITCGAALLALVAQHSAVWAATKRLRNRPDQITAFFCGSQKTLANGAPMAATIFSGNIQSLQLDPGIILIPLLIYHLSQLVLAGFLLPRLKTRVRDLPN
jgi:sodium/bile acid cotransporter 7